MAKLQVMISKIKEIFSSLSQNFGQKTKDVNIGEATSSWLRLNRWLVFLFFVASASLMVFYVNNVLVINELTKEIAELKRAKSRLENLNNMLSKEITELESAERIYPMAESMGMIKSKTAPKIIKSKIRNN
jgi:cell division protein FtsL